MKFSENHLGIDIIRHAAGMPKPPVSVSRNSASAGGHTEKPTCMASSKSSAAHAMPTDPPPDRRIFRTTIHAPISSHTKVETMSTARMFLPSTPLYT